MWRIVALIAACLLAACSAKLEAFSTIAKCGTGTDAGISVTWLGTAGVLVSDGETRILIDPFVSRNRMPLSRVALRRELRSDEGMVARWAAKTSADEADAILITHAHYDHVIDAAAFGQISGATVYGSATAQNIVSGHGYANVAALPPKPGLWTVGDFTITVRKGQHGAILLGAVPFPGTVDAPLTPPATAWDYRVGTVSLIHLRHKNGSVIHLGSAGVTENILDGLNRPDEPVVVLLTLTGRADTRTYLREALGVTGADAVIPIHFDNIFLPLDQEMEVFGRAEFEEFVEVLSRYHPETTLMALPIGEECKILPL